MIQAFDGMIEVPVLAGVFIGSIEDRLDTFIKACIDEHLDPSREFTANITAAWEEFTPEEKRLLKVERELRQLRRIDWFDRFSWLKRFFGNYVKKRREAITEQLMESATRVRGGLMKGTIRRPRHVNPKTLLIRK